MSCNFNKVVLMGRLTRDPETKDLPSGTKVTELGLAINDTYSTNGEKRTDTLFIDCSAFGRTGENIERYFSKGRPILVEGKLTLSEWEKDDGSKGKKYRVRVDKFEFVDNKSAEEREIIPEEQTEDIEDSYDSLIGA